MLASHFKHLALTDTSVSIICMVGFVILVSIAAATFPMARLVGQRTEERFELSIKAISILLLDEIVRGSCSTVFGSIVGLVSTVFGCPRSTAELALAARCCRCCRGHGHGFGANTGTAVLRRRTGTGSIGYRRCCPTSTATHSPLGSVR